MTEEEAIRLPVNTVVAIAGKPRVLATRLERAYSSSGSVQGKLHAYTWKEDLGGTSEAIYFDLKDLSLEVAEDHANKLRTAIAPFTARCIATFNGSDPEIFVTDEAGIVIPSWKFLPSAMDEVLQPTKAYWDGFQAETSFPSPRACHEELTSQVWSGLTRIYQAARKYNPQATLVARDVIRVDRKDLIDAEDMHVNFGCAPSENAYGIPKIAIDNPREMPVRFSGCHYHHSYAPTTYQPLPPWWPNGTAIMIDKTAGILLTALGRDMEDPERRKYYGRPGEFRVKAPGYMEYRTPGSFVLRHPALFIFGADVCRMGFKMGIVMDGAKHFLDDAKDIIQNCDADAAVDVIKKHSDFFHIFLSRIYASTVVKETLTLLSDKRRRVATRFTDPVEKAWNLASRLPSDYRWAHTVPGLLS